MESNNMLTIDMAAARLHCHPETVRRMLRRGELRGVKFGKFWRIPREVLRRIESGEDTLSSVTNIPQSPLVQALEKVRARDAAKRPHKKRKLGAAEELNLIRDERIAELNHER